jgi:hypothetical protein
MTRTAFADFCAEQDARNTIQLNVTKWTLMLCDALKQDYIRYAIESHNNAIFHADAGDSYSVNCHKTCIEELKNGQCDYDFTFESGRKYHKVIMNAHGSTVLAVCIASLIRRLVRFTSLPVGSLLRKVFVTICESLSNVNGCWKMLTGQVVIFMLSDDNNT